MKHYLLLDKKYRHSGNVYSLAIRKNGDCCGPLGNGCIHSGLSTSISG